MLFLAMACFFIYHAALAEGHNVPWAASEARSYLEPCPQPAATDEERACPKWQEIFVQRYQDAMSGSWWAQHDIAGQFMQGTYGLKRDRLQGCAWQLASALADLAHVSGAEVDRAADFCQPISENGFNLAKARATEIINRITAAGFHERQLSDQSDPNDP
jgi:hypothetical protein